MELTELIKDYIATELLSSTELDFLEAELWETIQHISEIITLTAAPKDICSKLELKDLYEIAKDANEISPESGKQELFENILNQYL